MLWKTGPKCIMTVCSQWKFHKVALEMLLLLVRCDTRLPTSAVQLFVNNVVNSTINIRKVRDTSLLSFSISSTREPGVNTVG